MHTVSDSVSSPPYRSLGSSITYHVAAEEKGITGSRYEEAGGDIDAGAALVEAIRPLAESTRRAGAEARLGGIGALFDLGAAGCRDPILVAGTDGIGTKLKLAIATGRHEAVGTELVAMCVNDLVAQGTEPLFILNYFATGTLNVETARAGEIAPGRP